MKSFFRSEVRDDRGQARPGLNLGELKKLEEAGDQRKELATRLRLAVKVEADRMTKLRAIRIGAAVLVAALLVTVRIALRWKIEPWFYWMFFGAGALLVRFFAKREIDQKLSASALAEGFCGSCGYSLRSTPVEADGCMACPECGAAWKPERITRPHWEGTSRVIDERVGFWEIVLYLTPSREYLTVSDDRGRYVRSLDRWFRLLRPERRAEWTEAELAEMRAQLAKIGLVRRMISATIGAVAIMLPVFSIMVMTRNKPLPPAVLAAIGGACLLPSLFFLWQGYRGSKGCKPHKLVKYLASVGMCGACGGKLTGAAPEADGCVLCPHCHAAWRVSPPSQPTV